MGINEKSMMINKASGKKPSIEEHSFYRQG